MAQKHTVGTLGRAVGRSPTQVRFYEAIGVIQSERDQSGRRLFDVSQEDVLRRHLQLKELERQRNHAVA